MTFGNKYSNAVRVLGVDQIRQAKSGHTGIVLGASDGIVEAIECTNCKKPVIGVQ